MKTILALMLMGLIGSANAAVPLTYFLTGFVSGIVTDAAASNEYTCKIVKTAPRPGENYTNEKSICVK